MHWNVLGTDEFEAWYTHTLDDAQRAAVAARVDLLEQYGPQLGRPTIDTLAGSKLANLKELRVSKGGALRVIFIFDPKRSAVLLLGGSKTGRWSEWYATAIPEAETLYERYLDETGQS